MAITTTTVFDGANNRNGGMVHALTTATVSRSRMERLRRCHGITTATALAVSPLTGTPNFTGKKRRINVELAFEHFMINSVIHT